MKIKNRIFSSCSIFFALMLSASLLAESLVLFSPDDRPTTKLISLINDAKKKIHAAVYMITDKNIALALIKAKQERGVDVQIITDKITMAKGWGKGKLLEENGIAIKALATPPPKKTADTEKFNFNTDPIMHHKFALIDNLLWTGSFNWTRAANQKNRENVIITDDKKLYKEYEKQFEKLKTQVALEPAKQNEPETFSSEFKAFCRKFLRMIKESF